MSVLYELINATKHKLFCSQRVAKTLCGAIMLQRVSRVKIRGEGGLEAQSQVKRRQTLIWTPMIALESADFLILLLHASWRSIFILILWSPDDISLRMWMLFLSTYRVVNWVHPYLDYTLHVWTIHDWTSAIWTTYDVWTIAVWTILDYRDVWTTRTFGLPPFGLLRQTD